MNNLKDIEILQLNAYGVPEGDEGLSEIFTVHRWWEAADTDALLREVGPRIRGIAGRPYPWKQDKAFLDRLPHLEITAVFGAGYDSIDMSEALRRNIMVTSTPGASADEVADGAMGLLIMAARDFRKADIFLRSGQWENGRHPLTPSLQKRKVGILGLGHIGKCIAARCAAFNLEVGYHGRSKQNVPYRYYSTLLEMANDVDVLMVAAPGIGDTRHMVNAEVLRALGPNGIVVNIARGWVVDEQALLHALRDKTILAAGLDVFEAEPQVPAEFLEMDNVICLPHMTGASTNAWINMSNMVIGNLVSWFEGKGALNPVPECREMAKARRPL